MAATDYSKTLQSLVGEMLAEYPQGDFREYWELGCSVTDEMPARKFYIHKRLASLGSSTDYLNVAILTDDSVVDIEGTIKDHREDSLPPSEQGSFAITPLRSIDSVSFHIERIQIIPKSENARLVLIAHILGNAGVGVYWIAETDDEYDCLVQFGKAVSKAVAKG